MWLSLICLLMIAGIAFFLSIHGLFSSLIFCVWTIICLCLAFALYELVAFEFLVAWKPDLALPIALVACFGIPLIGGRIALDMLIKRSGLLSALADRIGGFFFSVITALLLVGVLVTAVQMLPFGGPVLGYIRFDPAGEGATADQERNVWLKPDRFAVGMASMLSSGLFSYADGQRSLRADHPDLIMEIGWSQAGVPAGSRHLAKPGAIRVSSVAISELVYTKVMPNRNSELEYEGAYPAAGHEFWTVAFVPNTDAEDSDNQHRFTLGQIRLVGQRDDRPEQYLPVAVRDSQDAEQVHIKDIRKGADTEPVTFKLWKPDTDGEIKVTFEVREGFKPGYLVYKTGAWAEVRAPGLTEVVAPEVKVEEVEVADESADSGTDEAAAPSGRRRRGSSGRSSRRGRSGSGSAGNGSSRGGGRVSGARTQQGKSFFSDQVPATLTKFTKHSVEGVEVIGGRLQSGHVTASLGEQGDSGGGSAISHFEVPPGKRLLQLNVRQLKAGSTLGRALGFAVKTIRNYLVTDDQGDRYEMVGQYAIAEVDGRQVIELQYYPEQIGSIGRGSGKFQTIKDSHLKKSDTTLVYLFLVDQGRQVVEFSTGRGGTDLRSENLVAD